MLTALRETRIRSAVVWQVPLGAALAVVAVVGIGGQPAALGALYLAVVTPQLVREDLRSRRLPNALVLPGYLPVALGIAWRWVAGGAVPWAAVGCVLAVLAAFFAMNRLGGMGMGDVKLAGVLTGTLALVGPEAALVGLTLGFVAGALFALAMIATGRGTRKASIPFGPFLLAGFWLLAGLWFVSELWATGRMLASGWSVVG